ncbi:MAG TPA: CoA pyrophosphatase [Alphaproteobacteria bacterium]|nr:CoA pyrophosphatase [Alphaproteobacteria bacterium]
MKPAPSVPAKGGLTKGDIRRVFRDRPPGPDRGGGLGRGDHELNPGMFPAGALRAAAVLVPLVDRPQGFSILLTQRTEHLKQHAGQIAFPGGRVEDGDADAVATALREAEEEVGLVRTYVEPVGRLDRYVTRTGFTVTPVVALIEPEFTLKLDPNEVGDAFEVPLDFILDPGNRQTESYDFQGVTRYFYVFRYEQRNIWGATAGMLVNLAEIFAG